MFSFYTDMEGLRFPVYGGQFKEQTSPGSKHLDTADMEQYRFSVGGERKGFKGCRAE